MGVANVGTVGQDASSHRDLLAGQKAETRRRILAAAQEVFLAAGFSDANLNEIARRADVGKGTLYRHFESKGELYVAMLAEHGETLAREMAELIELEGPVLKQIEQIGRFYLDFWQRHPDHFQIIRAAHGDDRIGPISPELLARLRGIFEPPLRLLESLVRRGIERGEIRPVDPWHVANALAMSANAVVGPMVMGALPVVDRDLRGVYDQLQDLLIAGLAATDATGD